MNEQDRKLLQAIFDRGAVGILAQGRKAMGADGTCAYRAPDGCKCFIGHAIPDEKYRPGLEGMNAYENPVMEALGLPVGRGLGQALTYFQRIHDSRPPMHWRRALKETADDMGLDTSCLKPFEFLDQENP